MLFLRCLYHDLKKIRLIYELPVSVSKHVAYATLYIFAVESALAVASFVPVALNDISRTSASCPLNVCTHVPFLTSHNRHVPSIDPVAQYYPVNSNNVLLIYCVCPSNT